METKLINSRILIHTLYGNQNIWKNLKQNRIQINPKLLHENENRKSVIYIWNKNEQKQRSLWYLDSIGDSEEVLITCREFIDDFVALKQTNSVPLVNFVF
jgi:hypothetical protein